MTTIVEDIVKEIATQEENEPLQDLVAAFMKTAQSPDAENVIADIQLGMRLIKELTPLVKKHDALREVVKWLF